MISIPTIQRYMLFICGLGITTLVPHSLRGIYLWGGTINALLICYYKQKLTPQLSLITLGGILHSVCHLQWPFLVETRSGFDPSVSSFYDVLFHTVMLIFIWLSMKKYISIYVNGVTKFCICGSVLNCLLTDYKSSDKNDPIYLLFNCTSVFQAISTAYWIASILHYKQWHTDEYIYGLIVCIVTIVSNWYIYECDHLADLGLELIHMSMKYRYIEGLFIVSTWIPLLYTN